jgi:predicted nucleic acid-binding protein
MTLAVVDASVAVKWYVREAGSESALRLLAPEAFELLAPDIFLSEVADALLRQEREGQLSAEALDAALADLRRTRPRLVPASEVMDRAAILARALPHPTTTVSTSPWRTRRMRSSSPPTGSLSRGAASG